MSIWRGILRPQKAEGRDVTFDGNWWRPGLFSSGNSAADVDAQHISVAEQSVAISSSVDLLASIVSELPVKYYSGDGSARKEIKQPPWLDDPAGDGHGQQDWKYQLVYSWLYRGNVFGDILQRLAGDRGYLKQMILFHPDKVSGQIVDGEIQWFTEGKQIPAGRMFHRRAFPVPGQVLGQSVIERNAKQIGQSVAATRFGKSWFDADAQPVGILRNNMTTIQGGQGKQAKDVFMAALRGNREPIVLGRGWDFQSISITPEESQFLQTMGWSEAQCARLFGPGVPQLLAYEVGGGLTYANLADFDITFLKYSLEKWLKRTERVISAFLPKPQFAEISRDALLQSSTYQRYQAYALALQNKPWKEVNEVREIENLPPLAEPDLATAPEPDPVPADEPADPQDPGA